MSSSPSTETPAVTFVCGCNMLSRSACDGLPFYKAHEGKQYCVLHYPDKEKKPAFDEALKRKLEAENFDFREVWFPDNVDFLGFKFSKTVNFYTAKFSTGADFSSATFEADASFSLATFDACVNFVSTEFKSKADFISTTFGEGANFYKAKFGAVASFRTAIFNAKADFSEARFSDRANFIDGVFNVGADADFSYARFGGDADFTTVFYALANFNYAHFTKEAYFRSAYFHAEANFRSATFSTYARFGGGGWFEDKSFLDLQFARVEKPEHVSFDRLALRPHWFVNIDPRKFDFINVTWHGRLRGELRALEAKRIYPSHRLLARACRYLAVNAEENHRYGEASMFRYWSMEARRLETSVRSAFRRLKSSLRRDWGVRGRTLARFRRFGKVYWKSFDPLHWIYWVVSGYGERVFQAFAVLVVIWVIFALLYTQVGFTRSDPRAGTEKGSAEGRRNEVAEPLHWRPALTYSLGAMTLQKPEPRPATNAAQSLVVLETILGPVQAALLALAIRRKFMR